jgi:GntR family transcriptional regulator
LKNTTDPTPLYFKLRNVLRQAIESLEYPSGSRLPPERDMATLYGVSRITVRQALEALAREGLIRRTRGRKGGTFVQGTVAGEPAPKVVGDFNVVVSPRQFRKIAVDAFDMRTADPAVVNALHLPVPCPVRYIERRLFGAFGPVAFVRNFLPSAVGSKVQRRDLRTATLYEVLTRKLGVKITEVQDEVAAVLADSRIAARLGVGVGSALLSIRRLYFAAGDEPVNLTILITRSDRYKVSVQLQPRRFE